MAGLSCPPSIWSPPPSSRPALLCTPTPDTLASCRDIMLLGVEATELAPLLSPPFMFIPGMLLAKDWEEFWRERLRRRRRVANLVQA